MLHLSGLESEDIRTFLFLITSWILLRLLNVCNSISKSDNEEMASNNNPIPNDEEIYDGTLKNIYIFKQKIHDYF